jgi:hypothetical protein
MPRVGTRVDTHILFDMSKVSRLLEPRHIPVQILQPLIQQWIIVSYCAKVALEVLHINRIKPDQRRVEPEIELSNLRPQDIWPSVFRQKFFKSVQRLKNRYNILVVSSLVWRKPSFVDSSIQICLHPFSHLIDLLPQFLWIEIYVAIFPQQNRIESSIKIPQYFQTLIINQLICLLIPQNWYTVTSFVVFLLLEIYFVYVLASKQLICRCTLVWIVFGGEFPSWPAFVVSFRVRLDDGDVDDISQSF